MAEASGAAADRGPEVALNSLVVPGVEALEGGELAREQRQARLMNPEAVAARVRSRTEFEHLGAARAVQVAREAFPGVVDETAGGAPKLPTGDRLLGYVTSHAAAVALPGGKHGVIESLQPIATPGGHGRFTPIDLGLHPGAGGYAPANSDVAVRIPTQVSAGVGMPSDGVSLTPANAKGQPLGGSEGAQDGASVVYANTQTDTDTLAKPTTGGFEIDSLLRSVDSPGTLYFKVGMPAGAKLMSDPVPGGTRVVLDGQTIAAIVVPSAQDAAGTSVPIRTTIAGSTLVVTVAHGSGEYDYPIELDPIAHAYDSTLKLPSTEESNTETNWRYHEEPSGKFKAPYSTGSGYVMATQGSISEGEHDEFRYGAHGHASITYIEEESEASASQQSGATTRLEFATGGGPEYTYYLANAGESYKKTKESACDNVLGEGECRAATFGNEVWIMQTATKSAPEGYGFWLELNNATVGTRQEEGPEVSFNTSEATISEAAGRQNVLYGSGGWLGEHNGAFEITAKDPGLGVSDVKVKDLTAGTGGVHWEFNDPVYAEHECTGVWCNETFKSNGANGVYFPYNKEMAEGTNTLELCAEDEALLKTCTDATVDVDNTSPREITLSGLAETGAEISATQHQITVEAKDGTKPTPSSGIKSIKVLVDGREIAGPSASCPLGECAAHGTWTIDGESLGAGEHKLEIVATDKAGNVSPSSTKVVTFAIRNATPTKIGPGTVDPLTGQFALGANDVTMAGAGGVSRSYDSRSPSANLESPLGPQWNLNAGTGQSLKLLPDGSAELQGSGGEPTIFASNGKGGLEAPKGDGNLTLEAKEKEAGKGVTEYLLKAPAQGITAKFEQPNGFQLTALTFSGEFGSSGTAGGQFQQPTAIAVDSKNNIWIADSSNNRVEEFNEKQEFVAAFGYGVTNGEQKFEVCTTTCRSGLSGDGNGQFSNMSGIAVDAKGNVWVADYNSSTLFGGLFKDSRVEEFNEKLEYVAQFGSYGTGSGQFEYPNGLTVDTKGNVWVADRSNNRVDEFNEKREFIAAFGYGVNSGGAKLEVCTTACRVGTMGGGNGQFYNPTGIAVDAKGNIWVVDTGNFRVEEFNEKLEYVAQFGSYGTGNGQFEGANALAIDAAGDVWVLDKVNDRAQEFNEKGEYVSQLGSSGVGSGQLSYPGGLAFDHRGTLWIADTGNNRVERWNHLTWLATKTEGTASDSTQATSYRSVMIEGHVVTEPIEELGPVPAGVSCGKNPAVGSQAELSARLAELKAGCRALSFTYAEKTTATGEGLSGWGEYNGRLMSVSLTAYNPSTKAMQTTAVAQYSYDNKGRLRAEWDPRISPALKTYYGYDPEGHVTSLTPPGQGTWALTYGAIAGDPDTGRLLKVRRGKSLWGGGALYAIEGPTISGTPVVGDTLGAWRGTYINGPVAYGYQWKDCNTEGKECALIPGATNANYKVAESDVGHTLAVQVVATNGGGSTVLASNATHVVTTSGTKTEGEQYSPEPGSTVEYRVPLSGSSAPQQMTSTELAKWGQTKDQPMEATALFPPDEPQGWPASDYKRATVLYMDGQARTTNTASPSGAISTAEYNSLNDATRTLSAADRALALKEGSKSAEVAKALSSEKIYNSEGTQLLETLGPEHKIKLPNGTEEETRDRQKFSYNEGAPSKGETYDLATKVASWAEGAVNKELEKHEKTLAYSNSEQGERGWLLRKPIVVSEKINKEQTSTETMTYSPETGDALETAASVSNNAPVYAFQFGSVGAAGGQFKGPVADAFDASTDLWVTDVNNARVQEFSAAGAFIKAIGWGVSNGKSEFEVCTSSCQAGISGSGEGQFSKPEGIAINQTTGNVYVVDKSNNRIEEFEGSTGKFVRKFGKSGSGEGELNNPLGIAITPTGGEVWIGDAFNQRVDKFSETGVPKGSFGKGGTGNGEFVDPDGIAFADGDAYVVDIGNNRVQEFSMSGKYVSQFGSKGAGNGQFNEPYGVTADPVSGDLYVGDAGNGRVEEFAPGGTFVDAFGKKGSGNGELSNAEKVAINSAGDIYVADVGNNRIEEFEPVPSAPIYTSQFGNAGLESEKLSNPYADAVDAHGNLWVVNTNKDSIEEFSAAGAFLHSFGSAGTGVGQFEHPSSVEINRTTGNVYIGDEGNNRVDELNEKGEFIETFGFGVSNGKTEFEVCTTGCKAGIAGGGTGQFNEPNGVALNAEGDIWVADQANSRIEEFSSAAVFIETIGFGVSNGEEKFEICTTGCRAGIQGSGNGQFSNPADVIAVNSGVYVADLSNSRVEKFTSKGEYVSKFGSYGTGNGQIEDASGLGADPNGNLYVADLNNNRIDEFTPSGTFLADFGTKGSGNGQMAEPSDVAISSSGTIYVADSSNNRIEQWTPAPRPGNEGAKDTKTIYYSEAANAEYPGCGKHPEWANLVCQAEPIAQPADSGPAALPVTVTTYNIWDEPETITETIGSVTRTTKKKYDGAGRETENENTSTSSADAALPTVTDEYSTETGALVELKQTLEGKEKAITSAYNAVGQLTSYTDAEGGTTKYTYDIDGRVEEISEPKGKQIYAYDPTTGFLTKLLDSAAGTFTATYGVSGEMLTEGYPNGMAAKYTYNSIGQATNLEYEKTTHCTEKCVWFRDSDAYGSGGKLATQTSTLSSESYSYNEEGQLSQTQETPVGGKGCITRLYGYSESTGERVNLATREPNEKGECASEGGLVEGHAYDVVGRLLDPGVVYDALDNMTKVPALDAGGSAITSSFYVDNQVATQEQSEKTIAYSYDPAGRAMVAKLKSKSGSTKTISHYAGPGDALTWTCEEEEGKKECEEAKETKWTRNIPGVDGALDAIQTNGGSPVLELHDLQGNIVATAADSETETKLLSTQNSTEFGVSPTGKTPKYGWLGAGDVESELETGVITSAGATYVPQLACTLQTEGVVPPGAAPNGVMVTQAYAPPELPWANQAGNEAAANTVVEQRAIEREAEEAQQKALQKSLEESKAGTGTTAGSSPELTHAEWLQAYDDYNNAMGNTAQAAFFGLSSFEKWINGIAGTASEAASTLYSWTWYDFPVEAQQAKAAWTFWVELTDPFGVGDVSLNCYKGSQEYGSAVSLTAPLGGPDDPIEDIRITSAMVVGCVKAAL